MTDMDDDHVRLRVVFLLEKAGPCRACELAEFIGVDTCRMVGILSAMRGIGTVDKFPYVTTEKWFLMSRLAQPQTPPLPP
jgi:hypothetical protein